KETRNNECNGEFEQIYTHAACCVEQASAQGLEMWGRLNDEGSKVRRRELPDFIDLFPDQRPGFHRFRRRGNCQTPVAQLSNEHPNGFSQAEGEPRRWTQHYKKGENSNCNSRQCPMAIKFSREPIEDWVERYRNDDAPDNDRQKWSDQDQRPVSQKSKAKYSNYQKHKFFIRCTEL